MEQFHCKAAELSKFRKHRFSVHRQRKIAKFDRWKKMLYIFLYFYICLKNREMFGFSSLCKINGLKIETAAANLRILFRMRDMF